MPEHRFVYRSRMPVDAERLFAWHERPGAFERLVPPWQRVELRRHEGVRNGKRAELRVYAGPFYRTWIAEHRHVEPGRQFADVQIEGPFGSWSHVHAMHPDGPERSFLEEQITYSLPFDRLLNPLAGGRVRSDLERLFAYRHRITAHDLTLHRRLGERRLRVAVTGSSGFLGRMLVAFLRSGGHEVIPVVRSPAEPSVQAIGWDPEAGTIAAERLEGMDVVVHLAGENPIGLHWTSRKRDRIRSSRIDGTRLLAEALGGLAHPPELFVSASGVGYYGDCGETIVTESDPSGSTFMAGVARDWESATSPASRAGIRVVQARIGAVLSPSGGALRRILPWFRAGLGASVPGANPYVSWIAPEDFLGALVHIMAEPSVVGPVNVVSPHPETLRGTAQALGRVLRRPVVLRVPAGLIRSVLGAAGRELFLTSVRAQPDVLMRSGFQFAYPTLPAALAHVLGKQH